MAKKKIGIYSTLESTSNHKVEDLYLIVDKESIVFSVKHKQTNQFVAFEHFVNSADNNGWHQLVAYLQNNSKLIQSTFGNVFFVWNSPRSILTKKQTQADTLLYQQELSLVHGTNNDEELYLMPYDDNYMLVFSVPDALSTLLSRSFPTGKWHHYTEYVLATPADDHLLVYLFENNFCMRIVKEGRTQFMNYAAVEGEDQNCYTILNACNSCGVDPATMVLKVWGANELTHFIQKLSPYFKFVEFIQAPNEGIGASLNTSAPQHIYSTYFIF